MESVAEPRLDGHVGARPPPAQSTRGSSNRGVSPASPPLSDGIREAHLPLKMSSVCWNEGAFVAYGEFILFGFLASARMVGRNVNRPGIDRRAPGPAGRGQSRPWDEAAP